MKSGPLRGRGSDAFHSITGFIKEEFCSSSFKNLCIFQISSGTNHVCQIFGISHQSGSGTAEQMSICDLEIYDLICWKNLTIYLTKYSSEIFSGISHTFHSITGFIRNPIWGSRGLRKTPHTTAVPIFQMIKIGLYIRFSQGFFPFLLKTFFCRMSYKKKLA